MTRVEADVDALQKLLQALEHFSYNQKAAKDGTQHEILATIASLERAEQRWRRELERRLAVLEHCQLEAARAAQAGYGWDCSREAWAVQEAEERLENVLRWRARVEDAADAYRVIASRFVHCIDFDLPHATSYLEDRIKALEAFHAARVGHGGS